MNNRKRKAPQSVVTPVRQQLLNDYDESSDEESEEANVNDDFCNGAAIAAEVVSD